MGCLTHQRPPPVLRHVWSLSGAAWRQSPHQKSAGREREEEEKERKKEERRRKRDRRKEKESKRSAKGEDLGVNTPFELLKNVKDTEKGGGRENTGKRLGVKHVRRDRNSQENTVTEDRLRCENRICFHSSVKPYIDEHCSIMSEKGLSSKS